MRPVIALLLAAVVLPSAGHAQSQPERAGARINNLKVLSNHVDDVTTPENILKSFVKPGMTDQQRSVALWTAAVRYRHQTAPPNEFLAADWEAHDPVKLFNVYGYCMCCCCSSILEALNRLDGRETRGRILNGHSVPEVKYHDDSAPSLRAKTPPLSGAGAPEVDGWHMFDCSLITLFPKPDGTMASVDEISQAVRDWYAQNPGFEGNSGKLVGLMREDGWMGWKEKGPALLAACPYNKSGYYPARTHGWDATMSEYNRKSEVYEYGYQLGHRALFSLRPGESLVREASNRGLHVNGDPGFDMLKARAPENDLAYVSEFLPGYNGGVVANGYHRYAPDLAASDLAQGALVYDNLVNRTGGTSLVRRDATKPGVAVIEMSSPYVYLGGRVKVSAVCAAGDTVSLSLSTNNGRTFEPLWSATKPGTVTETVSLGDRVTRRYSCQLKIEIRGAGKRTGLNTLAIENDIQHAPRTLPWLAKGDNTITVAGDSDSHIATRTVSCRITPDKGFTKNETTGTMGVVFDNMNVEDGSCWWKGGVGTMTVPIETPGDIASLRFGAQIRARGDKDVVKMMLSFDDGRTWREAAAIHGPTPGMTRYVSTTDIPAHTRKALLRYELSGNNTVGIFSFRADADYRDPIASRAFHPFMAVHRWKENGVEKTASHLITALPATYTIHADADPQMVSVSYEMAR